jgi:hypothetical protein
MKYLSILALLLMPLTSLAIDPIRIEIGKSYEGYSNEELRRRVWQLERAVGQLQDQVFQLALHKGPDPESSSKIWTCQIQSFGKTHIASGNTKASALAQVLKKCSDATNAIHCGESNAKCDNE